jgi:Domain of unknown function (DUF4252)
MKKHLILLAFIVFAGQTFAQSDSYQTLKDTFKQGDDVYSVSVSGMLCRTILRMAGEHEFRDAITDVKNIRVIVIPTTEFKKRDLSVAGFKKILKEDAFQELATVRDSGDDVSVFLQEGSKNRDRYFFLIDEGDEVIGVEIKGTVDMNVIYEMMKEESDVKVTGSK